MLREILDRHGIGIVVQPEEITTYFQRNSLRPDLVITDSQVFGKIAPWIPQDIPFTSFSIILAHHKGNFDRYLAGTSRIPELKDGDRILLLESCSHHVSVKISAGSKSPPFFVSIPESSWNSTISARLRPDRTSDNGLCPDHSMRRLYDHSHPIAPPSATGHRCPDSGQQLRHDYRLAPGHFRPCNSGIYLLSSQSIRLNPCPIIS